MKQLYTLLLIISFSCTSLLAQTGRAVNGIVKDSSGITVIGATVKLTSVKDTIQAMTTAEGTFNFRNVKASQFVISISSIGYTSFTRRYLYNDGTTALTLDPIILKEESKQLATVTINATRAVVIKEDTLEFRASDYKLQANAVTEDLLKRLPGVEVDKDGNVTTQGKAVTRVKVNGKDYFGGDLQTATKNLPADLIERIQVIDDYGDQANLTGVRSGDAEKVINITIRPDRNKGVFANAVAGAGSEDRYQLSLNGNYFNNTRQISVLGNLNNTNASLFNIGGGGQGGNRGGGGQGGGGFGSFGGGGGRGGNRGGAGGFGGDGITSVGSIGVNFRDQWGEKLTSYGNYSYFNRDNDVLSNVEEARANTAGSIFNNQTNNINTVSNNHRFNWNLEYQMDSLNYLKFSPSITYTETNSDASTTLAQTGNTSVNNLSQRNLTNNTTKSPNFGANLLYNHRFLKPRRNVSLNVGVTKTNTDVDQLSDVNGRYTNFMTGAFVRDDIRRQSVITDNAGISTFSRFLFIEPFGKRSTMELNWDYTRNSYDNSRETFDLLTAGARVEDQSNIYNYAFTSNNLGLTYRFTELKYNYSLGLSGQPTLLEGESVSRNVSSRRKGFNFVPIARFAYKFSRSKELNINYFGRNQEPNFTQIQPVADRSNLNNVIVGNPDLNAEFNHTLNMRYNTSDFATGRSFFTNFNATYATDKIVSNIVQLQQSQETRYVNMDGYYTLNGFYSLSIPIKQKKFVFGFNGSANYSNNLSLTDFIKNEGKNLILSQRLRVQVNPTDKIEFNPSAGYTFNKTNNSVESLKDYNTKITTWTLNADTRVTFLKTFVLGADLSKNFNKGFTGAVAANPLILNTYLEKQFFKDKRGTLRFQGYDLFKQNTNVSRSVVNTITTDTRSNRLSRYFMLSFTMRLQKFTGVQPDNMQQGPGNYRRDGQGGRPPGM